MSESHRATLAPMILAAAIALIVAWLWVRHVEHTKVGTALSWAFAAVVVISFAVIGAFVLAWPIVMARAALR